MASKSNKLVSVTGIEELDRAFDRFDKTTKKKHLRKGTRAAAKAVQEDAKRLVPHDTGALERSLKVRSLPRSRVSQGHGVHTGVSKNIRESQKNLRGGQLEKGMQAFADRDTFYGVFVELGTAKMAADPYLRPALYSNSATLLRKTREAIIESIKEAERKASK